MKQQAAVTVLAIVLLYLLLRKVWIETITSDITFPEGD